MNKFYTPSHLLSKTSFSKMKNWKIILGTIIKTCFHKNRNIVLLMFSFLCYMTSLSQTMPYTFTQTSGTYTAISGGTVWQSGVTVTTDAVSAAITLPFNFTFNGVLCDRIYISNNGFITLANATTTTAPTAATYNPISTTTGYIGAIAGYGYNLQQSTVATAAAEIRYQTLNTTPNQVFVVQFTDMARSTNPTSERLTFQIRLSETTNKIDIIYNTPTVAATSMTATNFGQLGLRGATNSSFSTRMVYATAPYNSWSTTGAAANNGATASVATASAGGPNVMAFSTTYKPTAGQTYSWTPVQSSFFQSLPYTQTFESTWQSMGATQDLPSATGVLTLPGCGNGSVRAHDVTTANSVWSTTSGSIAPGASQGTRCARFHSFNYSSGLKGYMDFYLNFSSAGTKQLSFDYINPTGTDVLNVYLSTDGGYTFGSVLGSYGVSAAWSTKSITTLSSSTSSTCVIRFEFISDFGNDDIGIDNINVSVPVVQPTITFNSITPSTTQCTATARTVSVDVTTPSGTVSGVTITYNNGSATGPVAMTNTTGNTWTYTIPAASPTNTNVSWSVTATNSLGGTKSYTGTSYQDDPNFGITGTGTASVSPVCAGGATSLSAVFSKSGTATIGTGTTTNSTSSSVSAWFGTWFGNGHAQILILGTELTSAGLTAGNLTGLNISISSTGSPTTLNNYTLKIGSTSATAITTFQTPTFTTVWGPTNYTPSTTGNNFTFTTPFNWDGSSNIIIDYCYANSVTGSSSAVNTYTTTAFSSFVNYNADGTGGAGACGTTTVSNTSSNRPNFVLVGNKVQTASAYSWSDGTSTVGSTNPLSVSPTTNTTYTCTATINSCPVVSNSVPVTVTTVSAPTADVSSSTQCGSAIPTVSVSGTAANMRWYSASSGGTLLQTGGLTYSTAISTTTTFYVAQVSGSCESQTRTPLTVTVNSPDPVQAYLDGSGTTGGHVSAPSDTICIGDTKHMYVIKSSGTTNTYSYTWTCGTTGNGLPGTTTVDNLDVSPTIAGTYTYTATGVDGSCTATSTTTLVVKTPLSALSYSSGATVSYCSGVAITNNTPTITGTPTSYSVSPALPTGLTLNTTTGVISGTPSITSSATNYTITARNGGCTTSYVVNITVLSPISGLSYTTPVTYCNNIAITPNTPTITGSPTSYSISPLLPMGLSINTTTGEITGTPTVVSAAANYTVTASNGGCTTTAIVNIKVTDVPSITTNPANISVATGSNATFTVASSNTPTSYLWEVNSGSGWSTVTNGGVYSGATTATLTITAAPITMTGYQYRATAVNACGNSAVSTAATLTVTYCTPATSGGSTYYISNFTTTGGTGNINNSSSGNASGYQDYYSSATLTAQTSTTINYSITVAGGSTYGQAIWIDFDENGIFAASEQVVSSSAYASSPLTGSFVIPSGTSAGTKRMRIVATFTPNNPSNPCTNSGSGEYEDYKVILTAPAVPTITSLGTSSGCVGTAITINGTNFVGITAANVKIGGTAVSSITSFTSTQIVAVIGSGTTGTVTVTTAGGTATSAGSFTVLSVPANPANPTSNSPQCSSPGVTLTATGTPPGGETWYWQTTAAGTTINTGVNDQATYNVTSSGTYYIRSYNGSCWSVGAGSLAVTVNNVPATVSATGIIPANSATNVCYAGSGAITSLTWTAVSGATSYDVYFGAGALPGTVTANVTTNSWTISPALAASTTYYWKVVAKNACGDAVGSSTWSFTTNSGPCYCTSNPSSNDGSGITGVTVGSATFSVADVTYYNYTGSIPDLTQGTSITSSITFATGYTYDSHIWIDFNDDGIFENTTEKVYTGVSTSTNPTTLNTTFPLSASAALGQHKMRIGTADAGQATPNSCYSGTFGVTIDLDVNVVAPTACSGTPTGGTVTVSPSSGASGSTYGVSASGFSTSTGITYQWQYSDDGTTWTNQGASSSTYASLTGLTAPAFGVVRSWRLVVTCTNSGISTNSTVGTFTTTYCQPSSTSISTYINSFSTSGGISNISNPTTGYTTGGYANYSASLSASQYPNSSITFSIAYVGGTAGLGIWVDWNNDGDFLDAGENVYNSNGCVAAGTYTPSFTVPVTQAIGNYRMRVIADYSGCTPTSCTIAGTRGEAEDYTLTVVPLPVCSGTPNTPTINASSATICISGTVSFTATGYSTGASGLSYQWQSSTDNFVSSINDIAGATTAATYTSGTISSTTYYRLKTTCSGSGLVSYSNIITITVNNPSIVSTTPAERCGTGTVTLGATGSAGTTLNWYAAASGGTSLGTGTTFTTPSISNTTTYYVGAEVTSSPLTITLGSGASTTSGSGASGGSYISPFSHYFGGYKAQYLIKASELIAAGFSAGNLTSMSYYVTSVGTTYNGFEINIGNSSATALTTTYETPIFTTVYSGNLTPNTGTFTIPFSSNFYWNGASNIVVQVCWSNNNNGGTASEVKYDATSFVALNYNYYDSYTPAAMCALTSATSTKSNRPQLSFNGIPLCSSSTRTPVVATVTQQATNPTLNTTTVNVCNDGSTITTLTASGSSYSSTVNLFSENFEGNSLGNLTLVNGTGHSPTNSNWTVRNSPYTPSTSVWNPTINSGSSYFALTNSDYSGATVHTYLVTSTLNALNFTTLNLTFKQFYSDFSSTADSAVVEVSTNGGTNWTVVTSYLTNQGTATSFSTASVNLNTYAGQSNLKVRFRYDAGWNDGWAIDDVLISGNQTINAYYTWSPSTGLYTDAAATTPYDSTTSPNLATVYAKPTSSITYTAIASYVSPQKCAGTNTATINVSQIPTATVNPALLYACDASAKLSLNSLNPVSSIINWTRTAGTGSASASGNPATVTGLSAGTNTYDITATNGACVNKPIGSVSVSMPTVSTTDITSTTSCDYCVYNDGNMKSLYNAGDGKLIATIEDDATVTPDKLDETQICVRFDPSVQTVVDDLGYNQPYLQRQWTIHPANGTRAKVTLYFTDAELLALQAAANTGNYQFSGYTSLSVTKYSGGQDGTFIAPASSGGTFVPATFSAYNGDHKVEFTVDNFSTFYIHPILFAFSVLPVELSSFNVACNNGEGILHWTTRSEVNAKEFVLERSSGNANIFVPIAVIPAAGNSNVTIEYSYTDNSIDDVPVYYRLKEVDNSGNYKYSSTITLICETAVTAFHAYPSLQSLMVEAHVAVAGDYSFTLVDIQGKEISQSIQTLQSGSSLFSITDITNLPKGIYMLRIQSKANNYSVTRKIAIN